MSVELESLVIMGVCAALGGVVSCVRAKLNGGVLVVSGKKDHKQDI